MQICAGAYVNFRARENQKKIAISASKFNPPFAAFRSAHLLRAEIRAILALYENRLWVRIRTSADRVSLAQLRQVRTRLFLKLRQFDS